MFVVYSRGNGSTALGFVFTILFTTFRPLFKTGDAPVLQNTVADENISTFVIENFYVSIMRVCVLYKIFQNVSEKTSADVGKHVLPLNRAFLTNFLPISNLNNFRTTRYLVA